MAFSNEIIQAVWETAVVVANNDSNHWRKDECGAWISRARYGSRASQYGWKIERLKPAAKGTNVDLSNLKALQWQNSIQEPAVPIATTVVARGKENVRQ